MLSVADVFSIGNYAEAVLWGLIALAFGLAAIRRGTGRGLRMRLLTGAAAFAAFGLSDVVEIQTGAWWRPWWLLVWKATCIAVLLAMLLDYIRRRRQPRATAD